MKTEVGKVLDSDLKAQHFQIYEVDGIRGTLKDLADYFNVDPISVSDLLSDGLSIQDALCTAAPGFRPKEKKKSVVEKKPVEEKKSVETKPAPVKEVKPAVTKNIAGATPVSTSAVTDVQDLGDILVITTTTTVVYRKAGGK